MSFQHNMLVCKIKHQFKYRQYASLSNYVICFETTNESYLGHKQNVTSYAQWSVRVHASAYV